MMDNEERRSPGAGRVPVETLVEICGNEPGIPAFEAESLDLSGRGMHVRTAYLPEEGAPLVCRFEDRGREIIVEGVVAWRKEQARGGEFGIQFTALDSGSVDALRELCGTDAAQDAADDEQASPDEPAAPSGAEPGTRVRLHIDGLGSPMKARVRDGGSRKVSVGSNLEFLKVGRHLEIEDLEAREKRGAHIACVDVVVDPQSQVPQLVVSLRFDDAEVTPEPSVIDTGMSATHRSPLPPAHMPAGVEQGRAESDEFDDDDFAEAELAPEDEVAAEAEAMKNRFGTIADNAGAVARSTGATLARAGAGAAQGLGKLFKGAGAKVMELKKKRSAHNDEAPRRTTAVPPSGVLSSRGVRLRPQSSSRDAVPATEPAPTAPPAKKARAKKIAIAASGVVLLATVVALATHRSAPPPGATAEAKTPAPALAKNVDVKQVDDQGNPIAAQQPAPGKPLSTKQELAPPGKKGVTADVPLFGPTPMATMEPAPLGSAPEQAADDPSSLDAEGAKELAAAKAAPAAADETFQDKPAVTHSAKKKVRPQDVGPWGHGHVHRPTIHRLRLDGPGSAIQGAINPTGFTVVIPGRKIMENGRAIAKRDKRIARVSTANTAGGAQISFKFRDGVPGYRVRLRHDYVEFLISAPSSSAPSSTKSSHHSKHHHSSKTAHSTSTHHHSKKSHHHQD